MVFQSITYLIFLSALLAVYYWLPRRPQNALLVIASCIFYGWIHPWYLILIGITALFDWGCALGMDASADQGRRKRFLILSLSVNFAVLGTYKYFGFFAENVTALLTTAGLMPSPWLVHLALPAGISFFTFQSASYALDVYWKKVPACRSLLDYATFVTFFPQLVAGPIERAGHMLPQYAQPRRVTLEAARSGLVLLLWGLLQKVVIADNCAIISQKVFSLGDASFPLVWGGVIAFGVQIYADFSGYTDMARGTARLLGVELCPNFNHPFLAQSPNDFWRRWHISLSTWFRDYVYIPLGGSRGGPGMLQRNLFITFLLSGLWHGASWNFLIWGAYHGLLVILWPMAAPSLTWLHGKGGFVGRGLRILLTYVLIHLGWLMFRETNLPMLIRHLSLNPLAAPMAEWRMGAAFALEAALYGLPLICLLPFLERKGLIPGKDNSCFHTWRWTVLQGACAALLLVVIVLYRSRTGSDFIYFQF